jgi:RND family efflux transporter MFP subunit
MATARYSGLSITFFVAALLVSASGLVQAQGASKPSAVMPVPAASVNSAAPAAKPAVPAAAPKSTIDRQEIRAQLAPQRYTTLAAEIGARISRLSAKEGSSFKVGQLLIAFDCSLQSAQHQRARAALTGAEKTLSANQRLSELGSIGKVEVDVSQAEVGKARAEISSTGAMLGKCQIKAPFSGRVADLRVREGQYVQPGQALMEILDDSVLELEFLVPSKWLAWVSVGYGFQVKIDETGKSYPAKVLRIGARVDPVSQSIKLVAAIDGRFPELISGMSGRINLAPPAGSGQ